MKIEHYSFGRMTIDGETYTSDLKVIMGTVYPNWWRKEGHVLHLSDIQDVVQASPKILVVGLGASGVMRLAHGLLDELKALGIECRAYPTGRAVEVFNDLVGQKGIADVAGAFHLTC